MQIANGDMMKGVRTLERRVARTISDHAMWAPRDSVLLGVSGGADSVCLALILAALECDFGIAHLNHGLRGPDSDQDQQFVAVLAHRLNRPCFQERIPAEALRGNLEAAGREARRRFFTRTAQREGFHRIALAHSLDDRVETFLMNLLRGAGTPGLSSMRPVAGRLVRPLINARRAEIEAYLEERGEPWRTDATNRDLRFSRNRMRGLALPELAREFNPRLVETLGRTIEIIESECDWMEDAAGRWLRERSGREPDAFVLDVAGLDREPRGFSRRVLRAAIRHAGATLEDIGFDRLEQMRSLLEAGKSGRTIQLPGGLEVERNFDALVFRRRSGVAEDYEYELPIPGRVEIAETGMIFEARAAAQAGADPATSQGGRVRVDGESLGPCVKIRNWKNGDFYHPIGRAASKLKTLFQEERIPRRWRRQWPVLVAGASIVWVASFPVSRDFVPTGRSRRIVEFEASPSRR